jgi:hypothetical protein
VSTDAVFFGIEKSYDIMCQLQAPAALSLDPPYLLDRRVENGYRNDVETVENKCLCSLGMKLRLNEVWTVPHVNSNINILQK